MGDADALAANLAFSQVKTLSRTSYRGGMSA